MSLTVVTLLKRHHAIYAEGDRSFWSTLGEHYLAQLVRGVRLFVPNVARIVCLTDSPECMPAGVEAVPFTRDDPSWWSKLQMFAPGVLSGRCLYLDLDNVIAAPLDALCALEGPLVMTDDVYYPGLPNASTLLFDAAAMAGAWRDYAANPIGTQRAYSTWPHASDQAYLASRFPDVPLFQSLLPAGYVLSAREVNDGADTTHTHLVFGDATPKPHASAHPFYAAHWS